MIPLTVEVNGRAVATEVAPATLLIDLLRGPLGLTGTHAGCDTAQCGACTVLIGGVSVKSCSLLAVQAQGKRITTVEGLAQGDQLHPLQQAFVDCHGLQCGFCTPGMLMTSACLLASNPSPSDAEIADALEGNLCRCTGYVNIVAAVRQAASALSRDGAAA
jgi:carbon-monoxide dehydrogenase small subunit